MELHKKKQVTFDSTVVVSIRPSNEDDEYCSWYSKEEIETMRLKRHFDGLELKNIIAKYNAYMGCTSESSITNLINYLSAAAPNFRGLESYMFPRVANRHLVIQNILRLQQYYDHILNHARYHEMECCERFKENIKEYISTTYKDDTESSIHQARILAIYDAKQIKLDYQKLHMNSGAKRKLTSPVLMGKQQASKMKQSSELTDVEHRSWSVRRILIASFFGSCSDFP